MAETRSPRLGVVRYSASTDSFSRADFDEAMQRLEERAAMYVQGTRAARPAAGTVGRYYFATDDKTIWYDDGTGWSSVGRVTEDQLVRASAAGVVAMTVQGFAGQTANLEEWKTSTGTVVASMSVAGLLTVATLTATTVNATTGTITTVNATAVNAQTVSATTSVTSPLFQGSAARAGGGGKLINISDAGPSNLDNLLYPGSCVMWWTASAPAGWLLLQGQVVSRTTYSALFAAWGTAFNTGGEAGTDFRLPDMRGVVPIGVNGTYALNATGGSATKTILAANLPPHAHDMTHTHSISHDHPASTTGTESADHAHYFDTGYSGGHSHSYSFPYNRTVANGAATGADSSAYGATTGGDGGHSHAGWTSGINANHTHTFDVPAFSGNSGAASASSTGNGPGTSSALDVMNPWRGVNWIVKT